MANSNGRRKAIAYQWYPGDWASDGLVRTLSFEERGLYREMLDVQWTDGSLPADDARCARAFGLPVDEFTRIYAAFAEKFESDGERRWDRRMRREQDSYSEYRERATAAGKRGAQSRWGAKRKAKALRSECESHANRIADACESHPNGNGKTMAPTPPHPTPSNNNGELEEADPPERALPGAHLIPEHLQQVVDEAVENARKQLESVPVPAMVAREGFGPFGLEGAVRACVAQLALDAVEGMQGDKSQQVAVQRALVGRQAADAVTAVLLKVAQPGNTRGLWRYAVKQWSQA
jgi:uncharacterized protein YdaU (DUF1376 family)